MLALSPLVVNMAILQVSGCGLMVFYIVLLWCMWSLQYSKRCFGVWDRYPQGHLGELIFVEGIRDRYARLYPCPVLSWIRVDTVRLDLWFRRRGCKFVPGWPS